MARARNIKPGFYKNEDLAECSVWARFIFPGLWMLADREGRLEDRPKRIKGELLPFDSADVEPLLKELEDKKFIIRYENSDGRFIQISKFSEHQSPHYSEKQSTIKPHTFQECRCLEDMAEGDELRELSESGHALKEGAQPPDSLIPDSLIPESPHTPGGGRKSAIEFKTFVAECKTKGERLISGYKPVFDYAESIKLPQEFVELCWAEFYRRHQPGGVSEAKRYKDWRKAFRNCLEGNWYKLWWLNGDAYELTTAGKTAQKAAA